MQRIFILLLSWTLSSQAFGVVEGLDLTDSALQEAFAPRKLMLFIGINEFTDPKFRPLKYPSKDVDDFEKFLKSHNESRRDESIVLLGANATQSSVNKALDDLEARNMNRDDTIIIYLSTHGMLAYENSKSLKRYAALYDTQFSNMTQTGMSLDYIQSRLSRFKSKKKALVLALCHSGSGKSELSPKVAEELSTMKADFFQKPLHEASAAMMVLSASSWGQPAREDEGLKNDIYTHFLIKGLKTHDLNGDGGISLFEAHEFARTKTYNFTRGRQTPSALVNVSGTDPIILNGKIKQRANPMIFADSDRFRNLQVSINGRIKGSLWDPKVVPSGRVRLTLVDPKNPDTPLVDKQVFLRKKESYPVTSLFSRKQTVGFEVGAMQMPTPIELTGVKSNSLIGYGLNLRVSEMWATNLQLSGGIGFTQKDGKLEYDYETVDYNLQVSKFETSLGWEIYLTKTFSVTTGIGGEYLEIRRSVADSDLQQPSQKYTTLLPKGDFTLKLSEIFNSTYLATGISYYPKIRKKWQTSDNATNFNPTATRIMAGYIF